jgi:hypothetical protein
MPAGHSTLLKGRWEGEQAASGNIAWLIDSRETS